MGNFYTNITLQGPDRDPVLAYLDEQAIVAYVAAPKPGTVIVYDQVSESQDVTVLTERTAQLSRRFTCPAFAVLNHDDDVLLYWLFENGTQTDSYDSTPGMFTGDDSPPTGGNAATLCRVFGVPESRADAIESILRAESGGESFLGPNSDITIADFLQASMSPESMNDLLRRLLGVESLEEMDPQEMMRRFKPPAGSNYTFAVDRHADLAEALGLPECSVGYGFNYLYRNEIPSGLTDDDLWLTGPET